MIEMVACILIILPIYRSNIPFYSVFHRWLERMSPLKYIIKTSLDNIDKSLTANYLNPVE